MKKKKNVDTLNTAKPTEDKSQVKEKNKTGKIIGFTILGIFIVGLIFAGIYIYQALEQPEKLFYTSSVNLQLTPKPMAGDIDTPSLSVQPAPTTSPLHNEDDIVNVLLMGLDQDYKSYAEKGGDFHTDSMIILAINFDKNTVDMISLPRDTFTYVPGIKGIYKLNAAVNCGGGKTDTGFKKACEAASWMLGGIDVNYYYAFELNTVKEIGNLIDGVDFNVEMSYRGTSGKYYKKGMQHLNGTGIYDYMRARTNATVGGHADTGRMDRCKAMLKAIFQKLKTLNLLTEIPSLLSTINKGLYTSVTLQQSISLANYAYNKIDLDSIRLHTMAGTTQSALSWNFCFLDQSERIKLIKEVYGKDVQPQEFVSYEYAKWLEDYGLKSVHYLGVAKEFLQYLKNISTDDLSNDQQQSYLALNDEYRKAQYAFNTAASALGSNDNEKMETENEALRDLTENLAKIIGYPNKLSWSVVSPWYKDHYINEVDVNFR